MVRFRYFIDRGEIYFDRGEKILKISEFSRGRGFFPPQYHLKECLVFFNFQNDFELYYDFWGEDFLNYISVFFPFRVESVGEVRKEGRCVVVEEGYRVLYNFQMEMGSTTSLSIFKIDRGSQLDDSCAQLPGGGYFWFCAPENDSDPPSGELRYKNFVENLTFLGMSTHEWVKTYCGVCWNF